MASVSKYALSSAKKQLISQEYNTYYKKYIKV